MGAKDWMLFYADDDPRETLRAAPPIDRDATRTLVERLHPRRDIVEIDDGSLFDNPNPPDGSVYAACLPGLSVVCTGEVALDVPSKLDPRFLACADGRTVYLHAMHSSVDWFAYAIWEGDGRLRRALSLSPDHGIMENTGAPLAFEEPYWAGDLPVDDGDPDFRYPLPFHPLELAEDALRALFGFNFEGEYHADDPDLERIALAGFSVRRRTLLGRLWNRSRT
jgi:hypothetical protein